MDWTESGIETRAIHAGQEPDPQTGAVVVPIYATSTYAQDGVGGLRQGYEYSRTGNPTRTALEESLASLEVGKRAFAFGSGLAATDTFIRSACKQGDEVILPIDAYGGSYRLFTKVLAEWGLKVTPVPLSDLDAVKAAVTDKTRVIWCETPTNPLLSLADISALAQIAHEAGALLAVDNTFATPYLQRPITLGADVVVHSMTKYLGGHSDTVAGAVIVNDDALADKIAFHQNAIGAICGPFDAWLVLRGIKTLGVRMDRHAENAEQIVEFLGTSAKVTKVHYPGLPDHPGHDIAAKQMKNFGGMVSFQVAGGPEEAKRIVAATKVFTLGESLGGVESLIEFPATMTHASVAGSPLEVPDDLIRLSVGIETADDLIADLRQALG